MHSGNYGAAIWREFESIYGPAWDKYCDLTDRFKQKKETDYSFEVKLEALHEYVWTTYKARHYAMELLFRWDELRDYNGKEEKS